MLKTQICVTRPQCVKLNLHILPNTKESSVGAKRSILMEKHAPFHVVSTYVRIFRNVTPVIHQHLLYCMQGRYISIYCTVCMADISAFTVLYAWQIHAGDRTEKLIVPKLVNIPHILWKPNVHYHIHKNPLLLPILKQINPDHISPQPTSCRSILISSSHPGLGLQSGLFPSGFPIKTLYMSILSPYMLHAPTSFFSIWSPENIGWGVQMIKLLIM